MIANEYIELSEVMQVEDKQSQTLYKISAVDNKTSWTFAKMVANLLT